MQIGDFFRTIFRPPLPEAEVIGQSLYARPTPASPLRLRLDLVPGPRSGEFTGVKATVLHPEGGEIDRVVLPFIEHGTFANHTRRFTRGIPGRVIYTAVDHWDGEHIWRLGDYTALADAVMSYVRLWFSDHPTDGKPADGPAAVTASTG